MSRCCCIVYCSRAQLGIASTKILGFKLRTRSCKEAWVGSSMQGRFVRKERSERDDMQRLETRARMQSMYGKGDLLCKAAHFSIRFLPKMAAISTRASVSSVLVKNGNRRVSRQSNVTPTDHMSSAVDCAQQSATLSRCVK